MRPPPAGRYSVPGGSQALEATELQTEHDAAALRLAAQQQVFRGQAGSVNGALTQACPDHTSLNREINPDSFAKLLCVAGEQERKQLPLPPLLVQTCQNVLTPLLDGTLRMKSGTESDLPALSPQPVF